MIEVEHLSKFYGAVCAVDRIGFTVNQGEIVGLLGPNGAGKTTTLRMLTGFLTPSAGTIRIKGGNVGRNATAARRLIGYLPESAPLYRDMLVYDYLAFVASVRRVGGRDGAGRITEVADLCGLAPVMHQPIGQLSKGYKQRVGLAHALLGDPEILVLDEPTSGLDPNQIVEIRQIIRRIGREKTIVFSTHILSEAEATCDRLIIIHQGRIAADGATAQLRSTARGDSVIHLTLMGASPPDVDRLLRTVEGVKHVGIAADGPVLAVTVNCPAAVDLRAKVYRAVKQTDWTVLAFYQQEQSLETIFRHLTAEN